MSKQWVVHCKKSSYDVYIGRGRDPVNDYMVAKWDNPFIIGNTYLVGEAITRERAIELYDGWLHSSKEGLELLKDIGELKGKILGCWCYPKPCHGDILAKLANTIDSFRGEYAFLSNFFLCPIELDGVIYPSVEHTYQASKTTSKLERDMVHKLRYCSKCKASNVNSLASKCLICARNLTIEVMTPGQSKKAGSMVTLRSDWEDIKVFPVMYDLLVKKFGLPSLQSMLLATGESELVEGNTWSDHFWGVCNGTGENWLGKLLMLIRDELRAEQ